jgi:hypothetical protein
MHDFAASYKAPPGATDPLFRARTGGLALVDIENSERLRVVFVVKENARPTKSIGWMTVKDTEPAEIIEFELLAIPPGKTAADMNIKAEAATRTQLIDAIAAKLPALYVYPDVANGMVAAIRAHQRNGDYGAITTDAELASLLTDHLQAVSHDLHIHVNFVPDVVPEGEPSLTDADKARIRADLERRNCGFAKTERLDGNIGYIKLDTFGPDEICGPKATAAFSSLAGVDALIFDLRENGGGQPSMVAFVASSLFDQRTHLNDLYERRDDKTTEYWTAPSVPGPKFVTQAVYVLTSHSTISAAEEFAYSLKNLKRATIVGEVTRGAAHPTRPARVGDHFILAVPSARGIDPRTKTDWEGTGVEPDVKVPADQALDTAKLLASHRQ